MALGNPTGISQVNSGLINQATMLGGAYEAAKRYLIEWQANVPNAAAQTAAGIASADQPQFNQWVADLMAFIAFMEGTQTAANTHAIVGDIAALKGVNL